MLHSIVKYLSLVFAAGSLGALANTIALFAAGYFGLLDALAVSIDYSLPIEAVYGRIVWGGIWGLLFLVPFAVKSYMVRGLVLSLGPTFFQLFYFFPRSGADIMGIYLGALAPVVVLFLNFIWGIAAGLWLYASEDRPEGPWFTKHYFE